MAISVCTAPAKAFDHSCVFKFCQCKSRRRTVVQPWPGVCAFAAPSIVTWMTGESTADDGQGDQGHLYTPQHLVADLAAGELLVSAIRCNQRVTSQDPLLDQVLQHVFAAVHEGISPRDDWLIWMMDRLAPMTPQVRLNSRGRPKQCRRGVAKPKCCCSRVC